MSSAAMALHRLGWCLVYGVSLLAHATRINDIQAIMQDSSATRTFRVGVVFSKPSADHFWGGSASGYKAYHQLYASVQHQLIGAGIPFDLLYLDELTTIDKVEEYLALIFPYASHLHLDKAQAIEDTLVACVQRKIGIIAAGDFLTHDSDNNPRSRNPYKTMMNVLGVQRVDGYGGESYDITVRAHRGHEAMEDWTEGEEMARYPNSYFSTYETEDGKEMRTLAYFEVCETGTGKCPMFPAAITTEVGAPIVHVATPNVMGDTNLLHSAVSWVVAVGMKASLSLKLTRHNNVFMSRCDVDQAMVAEFSGGRKDAVDPLFKRFMKPWFRKYSFVGTYFIDIGDAPEEGYYTDWDHSRPMYEEWMSYGNEIGSHSITHPFNLNKLRNWELEYELHGSKRMIMGNLSLSRLGMAQPGMPEMMKVNVEAERYYSSTYWSGGFSGVGAGFPSAIGWLSPDYEMVYIAPNMKFDFTLIDWLRMSTEEAIREWRNEIASIIKHAPGSIVVLPWHGYGVTEAEPKPADREYWYTSEMYEEALRYATLVGSEFVVGLDLHDRLRSFKGAQLHVEQVSASIIKVRVEANYWEHDALGAMAVCLPSRSTKVLQRVDGWQAFDDRCVFLAQGGGSFRVTLGDQSDAGTTRIIALPMRARLLYLSGDGVNFKVHLLAAGCIHVAVAAVDKNDWIIHTPGNPRRFTAFWEEIGVKLAVCVEGPAAQEYKFAVLRRSQSSVFETYSYPEAVEIVRADGKPSETTTTAGHSSTTLDVNPATSTATITTTKSAPSTDSAGCYNPQCGCPPFSLGPAWCNEDSAKYSSECQVSFTACEDCGDAIWCGRRGDVDGSEHDFHGALDV